MKHLSLLLFLLLSTAAVSSGLTPAELNSIGRRVWQNECGGTREGLTSWNSGENFASLGIGHFIWYPQGVNGPFEESFPALVKFLSQNGVNTPDWLADDCPWKTRAEFQSAARSERMTSLRDLLADTVALQARFLARRMETALPKMLRAASSGERGKIEANFERLAATAAGTFALIDYVNFKGEGIKDTERYRGEGWGLLQVLAKMESSGGSAASAFARSAEEVLTRRVRNAPADRHEERWLPGWKNRVRAYHQ